MVRVEFDEGINELAGAGLIHGRAHAAGVRKNLADGEQPGESNGEFEAQNFIEADSESAAANGGEERFPGQGIMIESAGGTIEFDGESDARGDARSQADQETKANTVADAEEDGVGYR